MDSKNNRSGDPLPRPQYERLNLPNDQHLDFWHQIIRDFDWTVARVQSKLLYHNNKKARTPFEGDTTS